MARINANELKEEDDYPEKDNVHEAICRVTEEAEKQPRSVQSFFANDRTLVVFREGILVTIEKELIRTGFEEHLKITKRHLEKKLLHAAGFEEILKRGVEDIFVDWDFQRDKSYIIFTLKP
ncbi:hypothetical protein JCM19037_370 [Geomicrobium sp. JCM 19037]|uniref:Na-translocating system protein MpsC family protein n=1 Tax=Geomicrobium sp. JCM 19037 TaxID=1460634 RepID=UPI00045F428D|nr:Na-translocating system protein MpsC family protein [Geomicrobium sp. JCM 19037]GAK02154.1 hypothetical protein JCM19037_370 [Geomicrobium sp. JCM 19037]